MSLHDSRLSQVLPIIRCSDCGQDILFRKLSEHICISAPDMPTLPLYIPNPESDTQTIPPTTKSISICTSPLSPIRSASVRSKPALPYLEKYSKRKSTSAPALLSHPISLTSQRPKIDRNSLRLQTQEEEQPQPQPQQEQPKRAISPIIAAALSDNDQDLVAPRASVDERFSPLKSGRYTPEIAQDKSPMLETICNYPVRPTRTSQQLPVIPRKSTARTSAIAPRRGLGITTDSSKLAPLTTEQTADAKTEFSQDQEREREWKKSNPSISTTSLSSTPSAAASTTSEPTRPSSFESTYSSSSLDDKDSSLVKSDASIATNPLRPERARRSTSLRPSEQSSYSSVLSMYSPERESQLIVSPSTTPPGGSSPRSSTSAYSRHSPPLSPLDGPEDSEIAKEQSEAVYRPPTPESSSPSPIPPKNTSAHNDASEAIQPPRKNGVDQFETLMKDIMQEIKSKVMPASKRDSKRPAHTPVVETVRPERKRLTPPAPARIPAPIPTPIPAQTAIVRRTDNIKNSSTVLPKIIEQEVLCQADDTKRPTSPTSVQTRIANKTEETRGSLLPTLAQSRPTRRSEDIRKSPSIAPLQPRAVRRSEDIRSTPVPAPLQTRTTLPTEVTSPIPVRSKATYRTEVVESAPLSSPFHPKVTRQTGSISPIPARSKATYRTEVIESAPSSPPLRPKVNRETEVTPRNKVTYRTEVVESAPLSPPLRPSANRETIINRTETVKSTPLSPTLRPRVSRETEAINRTEVIKPSPLMPSPRSNVNRQAEVTNHTEVSNSTPLSSLLRPNVARETEVTKNSTSPTQSQTGLFDRNETLQKSVSPPPLKPRPPRRSDELIITPLSTKPKGSSRRSEEPASEPQSMNVRRSDELQGQRNIKEVKGKTVRISEPVIRNDKAEFPDKNMKAEKESYSSRGREQEQEHFDQSFELENDVIRSERIGRADKELERSSTSRPAARNRSKSSRGGIERCAECKLDIQPSELADSVKMAYGSYHTECLKCVQCRCFIPSVLDAHEYEGRIFCENDFTKKLEMEVLRPERRRICTGCEAPIQPTEQTVYALGKPWHEHHLFCYHCIKPIREAHIEKNGRVYCVKDHNELFLPKCNACGLTVESNAVSAQGNKLKGKWHSKCFRCQTCKKEFPDKKFYVFKDQPYCKRHYHRLNDSMCMRCDEPIEGHCAQTMEGWRFHPKCFCCSECGKKLKDNYYSHDGQTYCEKDMMRIQRTRNVRAERGNTIYGEL
ncbi:hypothetical protein BGX27_005846 [Mortierella sp. AM989]|nr:hypothetical protein BGX27_005846 [Mortierella sp. AM989]